MARNTKNKSINSGAFGSQRIMNHGAGKGDNDRTTNRALYNANLSETNLGLVPVSQDGTFERKGNTYRKVYGPRARKTTTNLKIEIR